MQPFTLPKQQIDFPLIETWIDKCNTDHINCREDHNSWYPTRLLHFGRQDQNLRLVISKDHSPSSTYITLSHRWPPKLNVQLKSSTMAEFQHGVEISRLPQVFQDSVKIAQRLGISYLWIDALCIQQDEDLSDWIIESQNMNKVYSKAFLNISATLSSDGGGSESLLRERDKDPTLPTKIKLDVDGTQQDYIIVDSNSWVDEIDNAPLNNRGWVFQERFSARRVIDFGRKQLGWECREAEALEMFPNGLPRAHTVSAISKPRIFKEFMDLSQSSNKTLDKGLASEWHVMVQNYSKCGLTQPKDKLIAFEGVTKGFMASRGGRCVAGVWEENIAYDLTWYRSSVDQESFPISSTSFRAPSWSWASVDGEVNFPDFLGELRHYFIDGGEILESGTNGNRGISKHPSIRVQGSCLLLKIAWSKGEMSSFKTGGFCFPLMDPFGATINLDGPEDEVQKLVLGATLLWLPLLATSHCIYGLVLAKIRGVHVHRRVGTVEIPTTESFPSVENDHDVEETIPSLDRARKHAEEGEDPFDTTKWNMTALKLVHHINQRRRLETFIH
jgi:hypothetical protein